MRVLVFGGDGQLGHELHRLDGRAGHAVVALAGHEVDITRPAEVAAAVREAACEVVVNAAAYTAVDRAEGEADLAFSVNREGARNLAAACRAAGAALVQISTDYVFDGTKQGAYSEDDPVAPLGVYGASKAAGEQAVRETLERHVIVRTSWLFGASGHNFVKTMLRLAGERDELRVVADQIGCPTPAADLAAAILGIAPLLGPGRWGTYHYCGAGRTTWFGFAEEVFAARARLSGAPAPRLCPVATAQLPTPAARPANSELDCARFVATFGLSPRPWRHGLVRVLRELLAA